MLDDGRKTEIWFDERLGFNWSCWARIEKKLL
jgi:hypothetical protein